MFVEHIVNSPILIGLDDDLLSDIASLPMYDPQGIVDMLIKNNPEERLMLRRVGMFLVEILASDGYIRTAFDSNYKLTAKGWTFHHQGGYVGEANRREAAATAEAESRDWGKRLQTLQVEIQRKANSLQRWLVALTLVLAIGTGVAAWYYGLEVWKYYHPAPLRAMPVSSGNQKTA